MKAVICLLALVAAANAGVLAPAVVAAPTIISRAPAFDSAVIKSDRLGGNFAYSVAENHAYAAHTPIVQQVAAPVAVSYSAPAVTYAHAAPVAYGYGYQQVAHAAPAVYAAGLGFNGLAVNGLGFNGLGFAHAGVLLVK